MARILWDVRHHPGREDPRAIVRRINATIEGAIRPFARQPRQGGHPLQRVATIGEQEHSRNSGEPSWIECADIYGIFSFGLRRKVALGRAAGWRRTVE